MKKKTTINKSSSKFVIFNVCLNLCCVEMGSQLFLCYITAQKTLETEIYLV